MKITAATDDKNRVMFWEIEPTMVLIGKAGYSQKQKHTFPIVSFRWSGPVGKLILRFVQEAYARGRKPRICFEQTQPDNGWEITLMIGVTPGNEVWLRKILPPQDDFLPLLLPEVDTILFCSACLLTPEALATFNRNFSQSRSYCLSLSCDSGYWDTVLSDYCTELPTVQSWLTPP